MYHYTNQPIYNRDVYPQSSTDATSKGQNEGLSVAQNEYIQNANTVIVTPLDNSQGASSELRVDKTQRTEKPLKTKNKKSVVDTSHFSIEERLVAGVWVHERKRTNVGMSQIKHDFWQRFGREPPAKNTLLAWERKLFATGSVHDAPRPGRPVKRLTRLDDVVASVRAAPGLSVRARARCLHLPPSTLRALLRRDLPAASAVAAPAKGNSASQLKPKVRARKKTPGDPSVVNAALNATKAD